MSLPNVFEISTLVYVAGVLLPHSRVSISTAFNAPPSATVSLPPSPLLYGLSRFDRIPIQIFIKESWLDFDLDPNDEDAEMSKYIMLFEGEITDFSYSSTGTSKEIVVNAHHIISFLRDVNINFMTSVRAIATKNMVKGEDITGYQVTVPGEYFPLSLFMRGLAPPSKESLIDTPSDFLKNLYDFVQTPGSMNQDNDSLLAKYYSKLAKFINLEKRYTRLPYFDKVGELWKSDGSTAGAFPLLAGIQTSTAIEQLQQASNGAMNVKNGPVKGSLYDILTYIVSMMEYEFAMFASPKYDSSSGEIVSSCLKPIFYEAMPPACNVLFRSMTGSLKTIEKTYQVPTRIRIFDNKSTLAHMIKGDNSPLAQSSLVDFYPSSTPADTPDITTNHYAKEMTMREEWTGTYLYEAQAPIWLSYITSTGNEDIKTLRQRVMEHLLILKQYEARNLEVDSALNPYITPGFPGAVFDAEDEGFTFVGHVVSVTHNISKRGCTTSTSLSFVRMVEEATMNPLHNPLDDINDVTTNSTKMSEVYNKVIGCPSTSFEDIEVLSNDINDSKHRDPKQAYQFNQRQGILRLPQFINLHGGQFAYTKDVDGNKIPTKLTGDYFEDRFDEDLISKLEQVAAEESVNKIYMYA